MRCSRNAMPGTASSTSSNDPIASDRPTASDVRGVPAPTSGSTISEPIATSTSCSIQPNTGTSIAHRGSGPKNSTTESNGTSAGPISGLPIVRTNRVARNRCTGRPASCSGPPARSRYGTISSSPSCCAVHTQNSASM